MRSKEVETAINNCKILIECLEKYKDTFYFTNEKAPLKASKGLETVLAYIEELEKYKRKHSLVKNHYISKEDLKKFFGERLLKYQEADDGNYDKAYLTRGELELVDRYGECKEIAEILLKEKVEIPRECISKDKIRDKIKEIKDYIEEFKPQGYIEDELNAKISVLKELLGE